MIHSPQMASTAKTGSGQSQDSGIPTRSPTGVAGAQVLSCCFPRSINRVADWKQNSWDSTSTHMGCQHHRWPLNLPCHFAGPSNGFLYICILKQLCDMGTAGIPTVQVRKLSHGKSQNALKFSLLMLGNDRGRIRPRHSAGNRGRGSGDRCQCRAGGKMRRQQ